MFGCEACLPIDLCFGTSPDGDGCSDYLQYVDKLKSAYELAVTVANKSHDKNKRQQSERPSVGERGSCARASSGLA